MSFRVRDAAACCALVAAGVLSSAGTAGAANIAVNSTQTFQTIEGLGVFASMPTLYRQAGQFWMPRPDSYEITRMVTDLGASVLRFELTPTVFPQQGEPYDWSGSVFGTGGMSESFRLMRSFRAQGTDRFIFSVWSPPCWMKESGSCTGPYESSAAAGPLGNWVVPPPGGNYQALANFIADFCQAVEDSVGVEPYGVSVQNEPYFHEPYNSCIYYEDGLNQLVTMTRAALNAKSLSTRIFGAEHMFSNGTGYYGLMLDNPGLYSWAVHGYTNGVTPDYGTATEWANMYTTVNGKGKKLWMTETTSPGSYLNTARNLHAAFLSGKVSLWSWWAYADNMGTYGLTDQVNTSFIPNGTYWGSRHYYRFVRPGANMIGCSSDLTTLWATAFKNTDNTYAVVLVNTAATATTATITGSGLPTSWQRFESSATRNCALTGSVGSTNVAVPANGVVTLFSGTAPVLPADTIANSIAAPTPSSTIGELNVKGDDQVEIYVNGNQVDLGADGIGLVALVQGVNVVACKLHNDAWGGGLLASMLLPENDTMRSGNTWKFTYQQPAADWITAGYRDDTWRQAIDVGPVDMWPGFERWGVSAVNLFYQGARWLYCDNKMYFRKNVNVPQAMTLFAFGNNFRYKCYVDGALVKESSTFVCSPNSCIGDVNPEVVTALTAGNHCIAWEITEAVVDGNGVLFKGFTRINTTTYGSVKVDTTWKAWPDLVTNWNTAGFNDASWFNPGLDSSTWMGRGPNNATVAYCYPRTFWYRTTFTSSQATGLKVSVRRTLADALPKVEFYNLRGQKVAARDARVAPNSMLIRKVIMPDGKVQSVKAVRCD